MTRATPATQTTAGGRRVVSEIAAYALRRSAATAAPAPYDGWAENIFAPGQHAVSDYGMDQRAALLWYHDHDMGVTQFTVYAGLAGLWIVRDEHERALDLPEGPPFEVPLLLQDRGFDVNPNSPGATKC